MSTWAGTVLSPNLPCLWMSLAYSDQCRISSQTCFWSDFFNVQCEMLLELFHNLKLPSSNCPPSLHPFHEYQACVEVWRFSLWAFCSLWFLIHRRNLHYSVCTFNYLESFPGGPELICTPFLLSCHRSSTFYWVYVQIVSWICFFFGFSTTAIEQTTPDPLF